MSDDNRPGDVPPDLPPEYAEAYRRGYERAYGKLSGEDDPDATKVREHRPLFADETAPPVPPAAPVPSTGTHRAEPPPAQLDVGMFAADVAPRERPVWLVPALLAGLVVVLLLGAYVIGRVLSDNLSDGSKSPQQSNGVVISDGTSASSSPTSSPKPHAKNYTGRTDSARIGGATATCEAPRGVDAAGHPVRYAPSNVYDQDMTTAWRCDGDGTAQKLTVELSHRTSVGQVGLIPGYAKTDPRSGVDRYAENNRITKVRWTFDDGTSIVQTFDPSSRRRTMQNIRIPVTKATQVVVEILGSQRGPRNTVAVSELRIGEITG